MNDDSGDYRTRKEEGIMIMKSIYLKKVMAGIMAVTMMSSLAFPAVYAEEPADVQTSGQSEDDIYDEDSDIYMVATEVFKELDPEGKGGDPKKYGEFASGSLSTMTVDSGIYINGKLQTCSLRKDLAYYEIKTYEGKELPVDELNAKFEKLKIENIKIENRDGEYVLLSSGKSDSKAVELISKCPDVSGINKIWYYIKSGWKMDHVTAEQANWKMPAELRTDPDKVVSWCSEFAPVEDHVFYYLNGEKENPLVLVNFSEPFKPGTVLTEKQFEFVSWIRDTLDEVEPDGTDEIVKKCRVPVYRSGFPCYSDGKLMLACDEVLEVRTDEGEKFLRFAGDTKKIEKVKEAPKDEDITGECYYYVEGEDPYVVFKNHGEIKTLEGVVIEPVLYLDVAAGTINYISNDEVFCDFSDGNMQLAYGMTDLRTILYKNYYIVLTRVKRSEISSNDDYLVKAGMSPANGGLSHIEAKGNVAGGYCVDLTDLSYLSLALLGDLELTDEQKEQGDVDNDGVLTIADLAKLRQFLSRKIETLSN